MYERLLQRITGYLKGLSENAVIEEHQSYNKVVKSIQLLCDTFEKESSRQLKERIAHLKEKREPHTSEEVMVETYALVAVALQRTLQLTPYDVQLLAAILLNDNRIIEMQTGEGKTIAAVFPACLQAFEGKGVHILTFNDYLARRDANWLRPVFEFMNLTVGYIQEEHDIEARRKAYHCDVTYATAKEVGFDFLRSGMIYNNSESCMRTLHRVLVDEADAILIDEARNPLVLAGVLDAAVVDRSAIASFVRTLIPDSHYSLDEYGRNVYLTEAGITFVESQFNIDNLYDTTNLEVLTAVNLALQAKTLLHLDVDYIIRDNQIKLVDEFTGRVVKNRKWQNGLQSAVEAKEGLPVLSEGRILNTITIPDLIGNYKTVCGMTGTARHAYEEFYSIYKLRVAVIPTRLPAVRKDLATVVLTHQAAKIKTITEEVRRIASTGQPVLIGTRTVKESEQLKTKLSDAGVDCVILNAKNDEVESEIIANAGALGMVTISTNMAGRGSDIKLGGKNNDPINKQKVSELGGLHVIGTNLHESIRIDDQLRGRAGRQGDPGSTQFVIGMDDDLMLKYKLKDLLPKALREVSQETPINHKILNKRIAQAQRIIEGQLFEIRHSLHRYSSIIEKQRRFFFLKRQQIIETDLIEYNEVKEYLLAQHDLYWAAYLADIGVLREHIYWERLTGKDPLHEFYKKADELFVSLMEKSEQLMRNTKLDTLSSVTVKRPASTLTYVINDNPFGNQLAIRLLQLAAYRF